ncbi:histidine phosphatase family protein [Aquiflexum lacus]|uniref:histidine phosphatase family protein n=1 Tax=Aquiflexum lacus TaxID=2483805 RepID=UPI0018933EBC|nr:histidine phosphatase family protein [Aquiflexum lacus]
MKSHLILIILFLAMFSCESSQEPKTIYIVRHAEKLLSGDDPELSVAGTVRSKKLAQILEEKDIQHIYSTNTIRTKATVQSLADKLGITIEIYDVKNHDDLVKNLRKNKGDALVVGHSNSIQNVVNYFVGSEEKYPELEDIEYDYIFVVDLFKDGGSKVKRAIYKEF